MITNWQEYTVIEIKNIFDNLGYKSSIGKEEMSCIVRMGDDTIGYFARSPNGLIEDVMVLDDERQRWR